MPKNLNIYFPINNLNPQGWISEFITPVIAKTGKNRDKLANLFYNTEFVETDKNEKEVIDALIKALGRDGFEKFRDLRKKNDQDKFIFLNGNFLDRFEVDETLKDSSLQDVELQKYTTFMSKIKPHQAAFLQSYMKLSYGYRNSKKDAFTFIDFPFTQKFDLDFILNNKTAKSEGSGISNVSVSNKFNLATHINSEISINFKFGNLKYLTQEINVNGRALAPGEKSPSPYGFSFTKLIANLDTSKELIRLEYGRKVAPGFNTVVDDPTLKDIIERKEKKVYLLNKNSHTFKFDETGAIDLGATYYNFHDTSLSAPTNIVIPSNTAENINKLKLNLNYGNLITNYWDIKSNIILLEDQLKKAKEISEAKNVDKSASDQKDATIKDITEKLAKQNKTLNLIKRSIKSDLTTTFLDRIKAQGQLFGINFQTIKKSNSFQVNSNIFLVSPEDDGKFLNIFSISSPTYNRDSFNKNAVIREWIKTNDKDSTEKLTSILGRVFNSPYTDTDQGKKTYGQIMFFPLKALITSAYSFLTEDEKKEMPSIVFGNVLMKVGDFMCSVNIGDLLIETSVFQKWYYNKFYKKDRLEYAFGTFINDMITDLVPEALYRNRVGFDDKAPTSAIKQNQFYLKQTIEDELRHNLYMNDDINNLKLFSKFISKNPTDNAKPLIYLGQLNNISTQVASPIFSNYGNSEFNFNELQDSQKGISHIKVGSDGGLLTSINFNATDFSKIRTALAMESLADKASRYFFFYYKLNLEMLGNNMFAYDSVVCVPSNPLGIDTEQNDIGIAGYYKIVDTTDSLDANNNYTTTAQADWVYNPRNDNREKQKISSAPIAKMRIVDTVSAKATDPINYIQELIENDVNTVINSQLQNMKNIQKKTSEKAKKDKQKNNTTAAGIDKLEFPPIAKLPKASNK